MTDHVTPEEARHPLEALIIELAQWSGVAERNGDLHARIASALALQKDYSPAYQDEYQRLWHKAAAERDSLASQVEELMRDIARLGEGVHQARALQADAEAQVEQMQAAWRHYSLALRDGRQLDADVFADELDALAALDAFRGES